MLEGLYTFQNLPPHFQMGLASLAVPEVFDTKAPS